MREYALVLLVTAAVTYLLTPLVRRVAIATRAIHEPRARDTHTEPTPLLGGLAMYGGLVAGLLLASRLSFVQDPFRTAGSRSQAGLLLAGGLVVLIGFADDRWGLSAISKLAAQVAAAGILVWSGQALPWLPLPNGGVFSLEPDLSVTLTILLVVVTINAINFIDGLDGLAAGIVAVAALSFLALLVHADPDHPQHLAVAARGGVRAAGRDVHRVPPAQLLPGADLHGRHRRDAARPAARLRPDIQHRFARSGPADQLLAEPHPGPVPDRSCRCWCRPRSSSSRTRT